MTRLRTRSGLRLNVPVRKFRRLSTVLAGLLVVAGCSSSGATPTASGPANTTGLQPPSAVSTQPVTITFFHYSGSNQDIVPEAVIKQYTTQHPYVTIKVVQGNNTSTFPGIEASVKTTGVPSVNCGYFNISSTTQGELDGIWLPLDPKVVTHLADFPQADIGPNNHGVAWGFTPVGLVYRTDLVSPPPTSWTALLDPKYAGHVALIDFPLITYNGLVPINRILGGTDDNLAQGFAAYQKAAQAGQFQSIFTSTSQIQNLLQTGDVELLGYAFGNVAPWIAQGMKLGYVVPTEGQVAFPIYFQILKGSTPEQVIQCENIINTLLDPSNLAEYAGYTYVAPTSSTVKLPSSLAGDPAYSSAAISGAMQLDWKALATNTDKNLQLWTEDVKNHLK